MQEDLSVYLEPTTYFDYESRIVADYARHFENDSLTLSQPELAVRLYLSVRDDIRYNPYTFSFDDDTFSASHVLGAGQSYCIPKAVLLGALARRFGIPSRLGLADVKNHLSSQQLIDHLRSDVFVMHGYIELYLEGHWLKATPAFNKALCHLMKVEPLEFNGREDSIFHEFNGDGERHMEYLADHGTFADVPVAFIKEQVAKAYPHLISEQAMAALAEHSLEQDMN